MAGLTMWCYRTPLGALVGATRLRRLESAEALVILDAVGVIWASGAHQPRVTPVRHNNASTTHQSSPALAVLFRSLIGERPAAPAMNLRGRVTATLRETGLESPFLADAVSRLSPGCSYLVVLSGRVDFDVVRPVLERGLARGDVQLLHAQLPDDGPDKLIRAVADLR